MQPGVIIVSNRLPVSVKRVDGNLEFYPSVGGLATGLSSYASNKKNKWIGWPGLPNEDLSESDRIVITDELKKHNCYPIFLTQKQLDDFYNGYSNSVLWPAFHELPSPSDSPEGWWNAYKRVNAMFAETVLALSTAGSTIWVHDYQLMLLPELLRAKRPIDKIGFFLHIPFPGIDAFDSVPHGTRLLAGLLGADLVGFHTASYVQNFLDNCQLVAVGIVAPHKLILPDRVVRVTDFPMGIDYGKFSHAVRRRGVKAEMLKLKAKYGKRRVILTVDRLDPTKGLVERLQAYREFLSQNKKMHGKVVMVMLAVPSRTEIPEYQALRRKLEKLVRDVNKEFGNLLWQPVDYMYKSVPFGQLTALYRRADVAFIAPIKDGMNLVAKEYLASKPRQSGVLILSETAGAAEELKDAILVNPGETGSLVSGLTRALRMPPKELKRRAGKMQKHLAEFTVHEWAGTFMKSLQQPVSAKPHLTWQLNAARAEELSEAYIRAKHRLLLLDYDGVLVPFHSKPETAVPSDKLKKLLKKLAGSAGTEVCVISGRHKEDLQEWFGYAANLTLIAEHGAYIRPRNSKRWRQTPHVDLAWKDEVLQILEIYAAKTPGATVETKQASLVWHYRRASPYYAHKHLVVLKRLLGRIAKHYPITVEQGNMILEIRSEGVHKGSAALDELGNKTDFVLAIGDDITDEDMFEHLPDWSHTVKVGRGRTKARYRLANCDAVLNLLENLTNV